MASFDYYRILGINRNASEDDVKKAYHEMALKWHPDKNMDNQIEATSMFQRISSAYHVLSDQRKRAKYDKDNAAKSSSRSSNNRFHPYARSSTAASRRGQHRKPFDEDSSRRSSRSPRQAVVQSGVSNTTVRFGVGGAVVYNGITNSTVYAGVGATTIYAGVKGSTVHCGVGDTTIYDGVRQSTIYCGGGNTAMYSAVVGCTIYAGNGDIAIHSSLSVCNTTIYSGTGKIKIDGRTINTSGNKALIKGYLANGNQVITVEKDGVLISKLVNGERQLGRK